jgi:hypothetical protein
MTSITIPASVTSIGVRAFLHSTRLARIYFKGNAPNIGESAFYGDTNTTAYYLPGKAGWGATFGGRPTAVWKQ